jgi:hypothetical protein
MQASITVWLHTQYRRSSSNDSTWHINLTLSWIFNLIYTILFFYKKHGRAGVNKLHHTLPSPPPTKHGDYPMFRVINEPACTNRGLPKKGSPNEPINPS